jgi:hypothetical protein
MPSMPSEAADERPFECPICHTIEIVSDTYGWMKHVYRDLQPYVCTYRDCGSADETFESPSMDQAREPGTPTDMDLQWSLQRDLPVQHAAGCTYQEAFACGYRRCADTGIDCDAGESDCQRYDALARFAVLKVSREGAPKAFGPPPRRASSICAP